MKCEIRHRLRSMGQFVRTMLPTGAVVDSYLERCNARPSLARAIAREAR
jgi:hypothetical protein